MLELIKMLAVIFSPIWCAFAFMAICSLLFKAIDAIKQ